MTTHVVMFRFHEPADAAEAARRLGELSGRIPGMTGLRVGLNGNTGPNAFQLALITEHDSPDALRDYAQHPAHKDVLGWLSERISERAVVDTEDF